MILYDAPETGLLYGATSNAAYLVKPSGSVATVIVASKGKSEKREATLKGNVWTCGTAEPPCKQLVECMKGTEIEYCKVHAEACAWTEDRSEASERLEHDGVVVNMRMLAHSPDKYTYIYYGVDKRGAFALRNNGSVLFVAGAKRPSWPLTGTYGGDPTTAQVLQAGYRPEKSAWVVGMQSVLRASSDPGKETPWGLIIFFICVVFILFIGIPLGVHAAKHFGKRRGRR